MADIQPALAQQALVIPRDTGLDPDDPMSVFALLDAGRRERLDGALITITGISGGAPRALGAQMAVLPDGRYCGYVSGGCIESAVATEAIRIIDEGRDQLLTFGTGSPFMDIQLPCGGSIDLHVHVKPDPALVTEARALLDARAPFVIAYQPKAGTATLIPGSGTRERCEWRDDAFFRHYHPLTRLILIGESHELVATAKLGRAAGLPVEAYMTAETGLETVRRFGATVTLLNGAKLPELPVDPFTAIVVLLHDRFKEARLLEAALRYDPFYIGALGSRRTHASRVARLEAAGVGAERIAQLHGPIGLYGPTRTSAALAVSVLGEITEARMRLDG